MKKPVAIVGSRGYSGLVLARIILSHPYMELKACFSRDANWNLSEDLPEATAQNIAHISTDDIVKHSDQFATIFLATPADASMSLVGELKDTDAQIIDLSGAFRLDLENHLNYYGFAQTQTTALNKSLYGLVPFVDAKALVKAKLIANPGCYATSVLMALIPLLKNNLIEKNSIVIDAKSGTTGAGKKASENLNFSEVDGGCLPYKVGRHQHLPEIIKYTESYSGQNIDPFFTTHLLPVRRGIIAGIYAKPISQDLSHGNSSDEKVTQEIINAYAKSYENYPLVKIANLTAKESNPLLTLQKVVGSARTQIVFHVLNGKIYVFSLIDNLMKGAASQAIENWNLSHGFDLETGIINQEGLL